MSKSASAGRSRRSAPRPVRSAGDAARDDVRHGRRVELRLRPVQPVGRARDRGVQGLARPPLLHAPEVRQAVQRHRHHRLDGVRRAVHRGRADRRDAVRSRRRSQATRRPSRPTRSDRGRSARVPRPAPSRGPASSGCGSSSLLLRVLVRGRDRRLPRRAPQGCALASAGNAAPARGAVARDDRSRRGERDRSTGRSARSGGARPTPRARARGVDARPGLCVSRACSSGTGGRSSAST